MNVNPIRTSTDYKATLAIVSKLVDKDPASRTPDGDRLDVLTTLIEAYEAKHFPIPSPDPIDLLQHVMESRGLTRKDREPYIGSSARVSEVLNRARPLTLAMIRRLSDALNLPADVLVQEYAAKAA
jgi:HTH-type transcriptional regulator / antitoxin HigA